MTQNITRDPVQAVAQFLAGEPGVEILATSWAEDAHGIADIVGTERGELFVCRVRMHVHGRATPDLTPGEQARQRYLGVQYIVRNAENFTRCRVDQAWFCPLWGGQYNLAYTRRIG
jgi:hypothetical protein